MSQDKIYVSSISADSIAALPMGSTQQITPTILPADATDKTVTYLSSDDTIATVSATGLVTGVSIGGPIIVTISAEDGSGVNQYIQVSIVQVDVTSIVAAPTSITTLPIGSTQQIVASVLPVNATIPALTYSSSDKNVADVDENGLVTGVSVGGPVDITIASTDGTAVTKIVPVTVIPIKVTSLVAEPISIPSLTIGDSQEITYTAFPENATNIAVTYASSNSTIATVDSEGLVTGVAVGSVTITLSATDGSGVTTTVPVTVAPIYVSSIMADPTSITLIEGNTQQVTYTILPVNATDSTVVYSSSDSGIATVDVDGLVTSIAAGFATIIISSTDGSDVYTTVPITVTPVYVESISPSPISISSLNIGSVQSITCTVLPANATSKALLYSSSDTTIATVTSNGAVTGIALGIAKITISAADGSGIDAVVPVTVIPTLVTSITSTPSSISALRIGNTQPLTTTVLPITANKSLIYTSANTTIATVSSVGAVTGVSAGTVIITISASDRSGVSTTVSVTIVPIYVTGIRSSPGGIPYFRVGDKQQITPTVFPSNATNTAVTYSSSDAAKVTVSSTGLLTGVGIGSVTITISATDGSNVSTNVLVKVIPILVTSIKSSPISVASLRVAGTQQLTTTVLPANSTNKAVTYSSSNTKIATVSAAGLVTGVAIGGPVNIMITAADGSRVGVAVPVIVVQTNVTSITSVPSSLPTLGLGGTQQLVPTILPATATKKAVTYSSSNTKIVTVSATGLVTGVALGGPVNITITATDGSRITSIVPVTVVPVKVTSITSAPSVLDALKIGSTQQLTPTVLPANAANKSVAYSSSNASIAKVSASGLVTGVALGTTNVIISARDGSGITKAVSVTVVPVQITSIAASSIAALAVGTTQKITPTILPVNATNKVLTYTSSDTSKVTVTSGGIVKGIAVGTANVTIAATDSSGVTKTVSVTVIRA